MNDGTVGLERQLFLEQEISHGLLRRAKKAEQKLQKIAELDVYNTSDFADVDFIWHSQLKAIIEDES